MIMKMIARITLVIFFSFVSTGCQKISDTVTSIINEFRPEPEVIKTASLCPAGKVTKVVEGHCEGDWSFEYDLTNKIYSCSFKHRETVTCPNGSIPIGQTSACGSQVDQHTLKKITTVKQCEDEFSGNVQVNYRLVCCI